eukprot:8731927-Lingulodinium_polyedra.AAC.1
MLAELPTTCGRPWGPPAHALARYRCTTGMQMLTWPANTLSDAKCYGPWPPTAHTLLAPACTARCQRRRNL